MTMNTKTILFFMLCFWLMITVNMANACGSSCCQSTDKTAQKQTKSCCSESKKTEEKKSCCSSEKQSTDTKKSCCSEEGKECDGSCKKSGCVCTPTITYMLDAKIEIRFAFYKAITEKNQTWGYSLSTPKPVYYPIWQPPKIAA